MQHAKACIGHDDLLKKQVEVLEVLYQGKDYFVWLRTGYGKRAFVTRLSWFGFDYKRGRMNAPKAVSELSVVIYIILVSHCQASRFRYFCC